ncbi:GNAT family N-acetyltransferase [Ornithinibacillus gellani]|uniref:GNAT family N-acetyltransferase n=1 Tax=Ornithinibacillus gellani TaxID=2293253 RepID=UPI000F4A00F5|nr:GNAT family N-acetyltransferase [Ornithinibacillus gellani]TQS76379.1 GNAT family N-acetyltransferase [Ornithinibacillus gellani]
MTIVFREDKYIEQVQLKALYEDVEWYAYTNDVDQLQQAISNSLYVLSAWDEGQLVGLLRAVGDGLTILYIQDVLVLRRYQNQGIASAMMKQVMEKYKAVRQKVLLTEEAPDVRHFYEKNGFQSCDQGTTVAFASFNL